MRPEVDMLDLAPKCKPETVWRLAQKWMDGVGEKPTTAEAWKALLDRLVDFMGGMIKQSFYLMQNWGELNPTPKGWETWEDDPSAVSKDVAEACLRHEGKLEALETISKRHSEVYDDIALLVCGR